MTARASWFRVICLSVVGPVGAGIWLAASGHGVLDTTVLCVTLALYFVPFFAVMPAEPRSMIAAAGGRLGRRAWLVVPLVFLTPNLLFLAYRGFATWPGTLALAGLPGLPMLPLFQARKISRTANWLPFEMGRVDRAWAIPGIEGTEIINVVLGVGYFAIAFAVVRRLPGIGLTLQLGPEDRRWLLCGFLTTTLLLLPLGVLTGYISYNGTVWPWASVVVASSFFGLTHLNNGPDPDWRFVLLAAVLGLVCGAAHYKTRSLTAPVLIHAGINAAKICYFQGG